MTPETENNIPFPHETIENSLKNSTSITEDSEAMRSAQQVNEMIDRAPTAEQSSRENTGSVRMPDDGRQFDAQPGDSPHGVPTHSVKDEESHDFTHRRDEKIQGEEVPTTGDHNERNPEANRL